MKNILILLALFLMHDAWAQATLERQVVASAGLSASTANFNVDCTIGEIAVTTMQSGNLILTQGFHQPTYNITSVGEVDANINVSVFPNPTTGLVNISIPNNDQAFSIQLFDISGRELYNHTYNNREQLVQINVAQYAAASYLLHITSAKAHSTYQILAIY